MPDFTTAQWVLIGALIAVELALLVTSLTMVARTSNERLTLPRIAWILICFIQIIGPIAFFAVGRRPAPHAEMAPAPQSEHAIESLIDELYPKK